MRDPEPMLRIELPPGEYKGQLLSVNGKESWIQRLQPSPDHHQNLTTSSLGHVGPTPAQNFVKFNLLLLYALSEEIAFKIDAHRTQTFFLQGRIYLCRVAGEYVILCTW